MRPKKFIKPARVNLITEEAEKHAATKALKAAGYTLSDYLQQCIYDLASGAVVVKRPSPPLKTTPAKTTE